MEFINRTNELNLLEREYQRRGGSLVVLYGRRRLGKTRLLREFFQARRGMFHASIEATRHIQLNRFREQLGVALDDPLLAKTEIADWETIFSYLAERLTTRAPAEGEKFVLVIDEFQYLTRTDPSLPSILQQAWDHRLQDLPVMVILCGSAVSMMHEQVLNSSSPLYGRRTAQIRLRPIRFVDYGAFVDRSVEERIYYHAVTGGVPKYIELVEDKPLERFIAETILDPGGYLYEEPRFLLSDEIRQYINYYSILQAISRGCRKGADIAAFVGVPFQALGPYLEILKEMHLVDRRVPITERMPHKSRKGIYVMADPFSAFWFRYVPRYASEIEQGTGDRVIRAVMHDLPNHVGPFFEDICRAVVASQGFLEEIGISPGAVQVGAWWDRSTEVDIVAFDEKSGTLILGECKLGQAGQADLHALVDKSRPLMDHYHPRRTVFSLFAKKVQEIRTDADFLAIDFQKLDDLLLRERLSS